MVKLDNVKKVLELDEYNKLKNYIENNNLSEEEKERVINESIKNHIYNENIRSEYNNNNNLKIEVKEKQKNNITVKIDDKIDGVLKNYKNKCNNDLEIAIIRIAKLFDIKTIDAKRIRFENKNYILEIDDYDKYELLSDKLSIEKSSITLEEDIMKIIEYPLEYIENKDDYFIFIIFNMLINNKDISLEKYRLKKNKLGTLNNFIYEEKNKDLTNDDIIFNNKIINYDNLLNCLFKNYFKYFERFLYKIITNYNETKIKEILDLELEQKNNDKNFIINNFEKIKELYKYKLLQIYNKHGIENIEELFKYLDSSVEFGTIIKYNDEFHEIPYGTLEAEEGKYNKRITYDNPDIIKFLNEYYNANKENINPTNIDLTQLFKSVSSINDIMINKYRLNYPLDIFKYEVGSSAEQMEFTALYLETQNIEYNRYVFSMINDNENIIESHFFIIYKNNNKWYYIENALTDFKGIYEYNSLDEAIDTVTSKMIYSKELNPYKELDEKRYILNKIDQLRYNTSLESINKFVLKSNKVDIKNAIFMYKCENEIRKNIIENKFTAYNKDYELIKPSDDIDNPNDYKEEYLKLLKENIMNIRYKSDKEGFFKVNQVGTKEIKEEKVEIVEEKRNYHILFLIIVLILIIIAICFQQLCGKIQ